MNDPFPPEPAGDAREAQLFQRALELEPGAARDAYLQSLHDASLERRLRELLAGYESEATGFLDPQVPEISPTVSNADPFEEQPGTVIGVYRLVQRLGEGGMGTVYLAEQELPLRRRVALKITKFGMNSREVLARFDIERQALALMDHPNIAKVLDSGATPNGRPYFVMELVEGIPITDFCAEQQLPPPVRLNLFVQVCRAVQHAHQKGIIHRDIKPSNVLVARQDGVPTPKVIDFGIAKAVNPGSVQKTVFTSMAMMIGTPAYMSPEQAELGGTDIDTRTDIYALGVLLYQLLTGSPPFPEERLRSLAFKEIQRVIREEEPELPSTRLGATAGTRPSGAPAGERELALLQGMLKGDLDWIVMKCLEKERARRYATANGLAADIERHLQNEPVAARPPSAVYRMTKFARRHRGAMLAGALVSISLIGGTIASLWQASRAFRAVRLAEDARAAERAQRERAEGERAVASRNAYAAQMLIAQTDWDSHNLARFHDVLSETEACPERGFEWFYWQRAAHRDSLTLRGHLDTITSIAVSPDSRLIASGSSDRSARIWEAATGRLLHTLKGHADWIWAGAFSPDGTLLATASGDRTVRFWNVATGRLVHSVKGHLSGVPALAFSPDGKFLVTGSKDRTVKVWDVPSGQERLVLRGHQHEVWAVAVSPDGKWIGSGGKDRTIKIWDAKTARERSTLRGHEDWITSLAFSSSGRLVSGSGDRKAVVWDVGTGQKLLSLEGHRDWVTSVAFSPDDQTILTADLTGIIRLWNAANGQESGSLKGHEAAVQSAAFTPTGRQIVSGSWDRTVKVWDRQSAAGPPALRGHTDEVTSVSLSENGALLASSSWDRTVRIWNISEGKQIQELRGHSDWVWAVAFSPDGKLLATGSADCSARIWDSDSWETRFVLSGHRGSIKAVAFSNDNLQLATASSDRTIRLWDVQTGKERLTLPGHEDEVLAVAFTPEGKHLVSSSKDSTFRVWETNGGRELSKIAGAGSPIDALAVSPDGQQVAVGSRDGVLSIRDISSGQTGKSFRGHSDAITCVAFTSDGQRLVSSSADRTVRVWDAQSSHELLRLQGHERSVRSLAIARNAQHIATAGADHVIRLWEAASREQTAFWTEAKRKWEAGQQSPRTERNESNDPSPITEWLVAGPFPVQAETLSDGGLDEAQIASEGALQPQAGESAGASASKQSWSKRSFPDGIIDFQKLFGGSHAHCAAYATSYVRADREEKELVLRIGSDDQARVWVNGELVYEERSGREFDPDTDAVGGIHLLAGWNVIVLKVLNEAGEWKASVRLTDQEGRAFAAKGASSAPP